MQVLYLLRLISFGDMNKEARELMLSWKKKMFPFIFGSTYD